MNIQYQARISIELFRVAVDIEEFSQNSGEQFIHKANEFFTMKDQMLFMKLLHPSLLTEPIVTMDGNVNEEFIGHCKTFRCYYCLLCW